MYDPNHCPQVEELGFAAQPAERPHLHVTVLSKLLNDPEHLPAEYSLTGKCETVA